MSLFPMVIAESRYDRTRRHGRSKRYKDSNLFILIIEEKCILTNRKLRKGIRKFFNQGSQIFFFDEIYISSFNYV